MKQMQRLWREILLPLEFWMIGDQAALFEGGLGDAVSHGDGICLNSPVWLDGKQILDDGKVIEPKLSDLAK